MGEVCPEAAAFQRLPAVRPKIGVEVKSLSSSKSVSSEYNVP